MEGQSKSRTTDIDVKVPINEDAVGAEATNSSVHQDDKDTDVTQTKDKADTTKMSSSSRFCIDIYGRVPGKEPKYNISCPSCKRELGVSRFCQHLEKCMGLGGRGVGSGSQAKRRKSSM